MSFFYYIYRRFRDVENAFFYAAWEVEDWPYPFYHLADPLWDLEDFFHRIANEFYDVWKWSGDVQDAIESAGGIPSWVLTKLSQAWDAATAIAGIIGTTFSQIVAFIRDHATTIIQYITENIYNTYQTVRNYITNVYETIYNNIYNTYQTVKNYITNVYETVTNYITNVYETVKNYVTNVYETITHVFNTYVTEIIGVAEDWVRDFVSAALAPFTAPFNLIATWFDDIQDFFNDPLGWLWDKMIGYLEKYW